MIKITSIKITNNYVELKLSDQSKYKISEDDYFDFKFKANMEINDEMFYTIKNISNFHNAYMKALNKIKYKDRTEYEIREMCYEDFNLIKPDVDKIINKLKRYDFINDERYTRDFIERSQFNYHGYNRIKSGLIDVKIKSQLISECLVYDYDKEYELAHTYANQTLKTIRNKTKVQVENSLRQKLVYRGFKSDVISSVISDIDVDYNYDLERNLIEKDVQKSIRRYSRKYNGYELRVRIFNYLQTRGYRFEMINEVLDEMEINNE